VLFLIACLLSGRAVLPQAQAPEICLTGLGILLLGQSEIIDRSSSSS
jgi:hypothetical protein